MSPTWLLWCLCFGGTDQIEDWSHVPILLPPHLTHPQVLGRQVCTTLGLFRVKVSTLGLMHDR